MELPGYWEAGIGARDLVASHTRPVRFMRTTWRFIMDKKVLVITMSFLACGMLPRVFAQIPVLRSDSHCPGQFRNQHA